MFKQLTEELSSLFENQVEETNLHSGNRCFIDLERPIKGLYDIENLVKKHSGKNVKGSLPVLLTDLCFVCANLKTADEGELDKIDYQCPYCVVISGETVGYRTHFVVYFAEKKNALGFLRDLRLEEADKLADYAEAQKFTANLDESTDDEWATFLDRYFDTDNLDVDGYVAKSSFDSRDTVCFWTFTEYRLTKAVLAQIKELKSVVDMTFDPKLNELSLELAVSPASSEKEINDTLSELRSLHDIIAEYENEGDESAALAEDIIDNFNPKVVKCVKDNEDGDTAWYNILIRSGKWDAWLDVSVEDGGFDYEWNQMSFSLTNIKDLVNQRVMADENVADKVYAAVEQYLQDKQII